MTTATTTPSVVEGQDVLTGQALLDFVKRMSPEISRSELCIQAGYSRVDARGNTVPKLNQFQNALLEAQGLFMQTGRRRTKSLTYKSHVHANGAIMITKRYTDTLGITPGSSVEIEPVDENGQIGFFVSVTPD